MEGLAEGVQVARVRMIRQMLLARGLNVSQHFPADKAAFAATSEAVLISAALDCADEADFLGSLGRS